MSHALTRGEFFQLIVALLDYKENINPLAHCRTFSDGCNDCSSNGDVTSCTTRMCVWQGTPKCYTCEAGYSLVGYRCVKTTTACVEEGGYAGGGHVMHAENPYDFMCCA
jgi:hypothetical protein